MTQQQRVSRAIIFYQCTGCSRIPFESLFVCEIVYRQANLFRALSRLPQIVPLTCVPFETLQPFTIYFKCEKVNAIEILFCGVSVITQLSRLL